MREFCPNNFWLIHLCTVNVPVATYEHILWDSVLNFYKATKIFQERDHQTYGALAHFIYARLCLGVEVYLMYKVCGEKASWILRNLFLHSLGFILMQLEWWCIKHMLGRARIYFYILHSMTQYKGMCHLCNGCLMLYTRPIVTGPRERC